MTTPEPFADDDEFTDIELAEVDEEEILGAGFTTLSSSEASESAAVKPAAEANRAEEDGPAESDEAAPADPRLTGARSVAAQLRQQAGGLAALDEAPLTEHVDYYQRAHSQLQQALSEIDSA